MQQKKGKNFEQTHKIASLNISCYIAELLRRYNIKLHTKQHLGKNKNKHSSNRIRTRALGTNATSYTKHLVQCLPDRNILGQNRRRLCASCWDKMKDDYVQTKIDGQLKAWRCLTSWNRAFCSACYKSEEREVDCCSI